jgi:hypothetical protein
VEGFEDHHGDDDTDADVDSTTYVVGVRQPKREYAHLSLRRGSDSDTDTEKAKERLKRQETLVASPVGEPTKPAKKRSRRKWGPLGRLKRKVTPKVIIRPKFS